MKKNIKLVLGLLASILCVGAIGGLGYGIYELSNPKEEVKEKHQVSINYYKDDVIDLNLGSSFEVDDDYLLNLSDYKINIEGYKYYKKDITSWNINIKEDLIVNFYYLKEDENNNDDEAKFFDINVDVYLSNEGIDGSYNHDQIYTINDVLDYELSITNAFNLLKEKYTKFNDYNLNFSSSYMDGLNFGVYLYNGKPLEDEEDNKNFDLSVLLYVDYKNDDDGYLGGQSYVVKNVSSSVTLQYVLSSVWASDQTIPRDVLIDYDLSSIQGTHCDLYIYEKADEIEEPENPDEDLSQYNHFYQILCHACGLEMKWSDYLNCAECSNIQCGGDGFYKKVEFWENPETLEIVKQNVLVEKGDYLDLTKSDFDN